MNNTWCRIAVCVFFSMTSSTFAVSAQEASFVLVALEQLRDCLERDDRGTLDEFVADVSTASGLSAAASRDSLVSLLRDLKTHCKKSTALGEQLFALHGAHFSEREAKAYLVRVVDMAGDLLKKEENVGLEPLIARAASKSKLLKFQALDYTAALLVPFVGSPVVEEPAEVRAEWILRHDVAENVYSASSDAVPVELYLGEDVPTETKTYVSVAFSCHPSNPTGRILIIFKEAVVFDPSKPMRAMLGYKVYGKPSRIGDPVQSYKTPVHSDKEFPRIVAVSSGFRKAFLQYVKSAHDDREHVLGLYFELKPKQIAFTETISLANAKASIRAAQKMCE